MIYYSNIKIVILLIAMSFCACLCAESAAAKNVINASRQSNSIARPDKNDLKEKNQMAAYTYNIECSSPEAPELADLFLKNSRLGAMIDKPASMATLEQRLAVSLKEGQDILSNRGYYDGHISGAIQVLNAQQAKAVITFTPGVQYKLGQSSSNITGKLKLHESAQAPAQTLWDTGLKPGDPALADNVLDAVTKIEKSFRNNGYPFAAITSSRYTLNRELKTLNISLDISPGAFARMGQPHNTGNAQISQSYLNGLRNWQIGQPWNKDLADDYAQSLKQSGLFQDVNLEMGDVKNDDVHDLKLNLASAPQRTVGGMVSYDTDFGLGLSAYWENRNFTGHGDRLRLDMPLRKDMQQFEANYRYPFFLSPKQDLLARSGITHENLDQYESLYAEANVGIERRLSRRWKASITATAEGGYITENGTSKKEYFMAGIPLSAAYDDSNSILNATRGQRLIVAVTPYTGNYRDNFTFIKTRLEGQKFLALDKKENIVLATKAVWGSIWGADTYQVPTSARFYSGGGGSVRGYDYKSLGPKNRWGKAAGGSAQAETSVETRFRLSENFGLVGFIDGGMVYDTTDSNAYAFKNMAWGTGIGARYFTPIGPVRVDVATPLNKRPEDSSVQLYISIGQSF